jgi:ferredoxin--NADP+ reductase
MTAVEAAGNVSHADSGPDLVEVKMHVAGPREPAVGIVTKNERCTAGRRAAGFVRHIEVDVSGTPLSGSFVPGQSFGVHAPGLDERGRPHALRLYSIASPTAGEDGAGGVIATTVKRLIDENADGPGLHVGVTSNYLCDLKPGDELRLSGPNGKRFVLPARPAEHDYVFFATGTGIAPFRGMVLDLLKTAPQSRIALVMGAPYETDLIYDDVFASLADRHSNFTYLPTVSRHAHRDASPACYVQDRLERDAGALGELLCSDRGLVYVCGLLGMDLGILQRMARTLPPEWVGRYLTIDPEVAHDVDGWTRKMVHRQVKPTRRMFLEVY